MAQSGSFDQAASYNAEAIAKHFDEFGLREWQRLVETPVDEVSLYVHAHYLKAYIPSGAQVLEIGAGAGRFTQILANLSTRVTVADISSGQLQLNRRHAQRYGFEHAVESRQQVDICDMSRFPDSTFDVVVAFGGPLSYVLERRDVALAECRRLLVPGGRLLLSVMSLWGSAHRALDGVLQVPVEANKQITASGDITRQTWPERQGGFLHMFRSDELRQWLEQAGFRVLGMSASNCLSMGWDGSLSAIRDEAEKWNELLRMELEACAQAGCLDMGTHLIGVAQRQ